MTITGIIEPNVYSVVGSTGPFIYEFDIDDSTDIVVNHTDADEVTTTYTVTTDYTIDTTAKTVTLTTALATGESIAISRATPLTQPTNFRNSSNTLKKTLEDIETSLDRNTKLFLELNEKYNRTPQADEGFVVSSSLSGLSIPAPVAGAYLKYNSTGDAIVNQTLSTSSVITEVGDDTSPQLGANFNLANFNITATNDIVFAPTGTNAVKINGSSSQGGTLKLAEQTTNGTNTVGLRSPSSISSSFNIKLPSTTGGVGQGLSNDGSGNLSWSNVVGSTETILASGTSSTFNVELTSSDFSFNKYLKYDIEIYDIDTSSINTFIKIQTSTDGGSTYDSGASDYRYVNYLHEGATTTTGADDTEDSIHVGKNASSGRITSVGDDTSGLKITMYNPSLANRHVFKWEGSSADLGSGPIQYTGMGTRLDTTPIDAIKISLNTGNGADSFKYKVYGKLRLDPPLYSLDYDSAQQDTLTMSGTNFGRSSHSATTMGFSFWTKFNSVPTAETIVMIMQESSAGGRDLEIGKTSTANGDLQNITIFWDTTGGQTCTAADNFTDTTTWHHVYWKIDSTQAVEADRVKCWIDGVAQTVTGTRPSLNDTIQHTTPNDAVYVGGNYANSFKADQKIYQLAVFDGGAGTLPDGDDLYNNGSPISIIDDASLFSYLVDTTGQNLYTEDYVISTDWAQNGTGTPAVSTDTP